VQSAAVHSRCFHRESKLRAHLRSVIFRLTLVNKPGDGRVVVTREASAHGTAIRLSYITKVTIRIVLIEDLQNGEYISTLIYISMAVAIIGKDLRFRKDVIDEWLTNMERQNGKGR